VFSVDGTPGVDNMPGKISFYTTNNGTATAVERMTIRNNGYVGIGTTGPTEKLTVNGNINVTNGYDVYDGEGNAYVTLADLSGRLVDEIDPIWSLDKPNYYTSLQVDNAISALAGGLTYRGSRDYSTGVLPADISTGDMYLIISGGNFNGLVLQANDQIIANTSSVGASATGDWDVLGVAATDGDPIFVASAAYDITSQLIVDWNQAHSRGDHRDM